MAGWDLDVVCLGLWLSGIVLDSAFLVTFDFILFYFILTLFILGFGA
jgi:hypothetical protein